MKRFFLCIAAYDVTMAVFCIGCWMHDLYLMTIVGVLIAVELVTLARAVLPSFWTKFPLAVAAVYFVTMATFCVGCWHRNLWVMVPAMVVLAVHGAVSGRLARRRYL